jgi:hypothetical protein
MPRKDPVDDAGNGFLSCGLSPFPEPNSNRSSIRPALAKLLHLLKAEEEATTSEVTYLHLGGNLTDASG